MFYQFFMCSQIQQYFHYKQTNKSKAILMLEHTILMITHSFTTAFCLGHARKWTRGEPCSGLPPASWASHRAQLPLDVSYAT